MDPSDLPLALAQMPAFLSLFSPDGTIAWYSRASYGLERGCLIGKPSDTLIVEEDRPAWWAAFRRALNLEQVAYSVRVRVPLPPGEVRLSGWLSPVVVGGDVRFVSCVCREADEPPAPPAAAPPAGPQPRQLVTLDQMAVMVARRKRSLERYRDEMPAPVVSGLPGQPSLWDWSEVRAWLSRRFGRDLPEDHAAMKW